MAAETLLSVLAGGLFGLALTAPPGPMNALIAEETVRNGWLSGFRTGLGAMTADFLFAVFALAGVATVVERTPRLRAGMVTVGGLLMLGFAADALRRGRPTAPERDERSGRGFSKALGLALTNPYQILFWLTVGVGLLQSGRLDVLGAVPLLGEGLTGVVVVTTGSPWLFVGLFGGILAWIIVFPALLLWARRQLATVEPLVVVGSAVLLTAFGLGFLWEGLTSFG